MTKERFHVVAKSAAGLLLAVSVVSSAVARQSRHLSGAHAQASVKESRGVVTSPSRVPAYDPRRARRPIRLARGPTSLTQTAHMATPIAGRYMVT